MPSQSNGPLRLVLKHEAPATCMSASEERWIDGRTTHTRRERTQERRPQAMNRQRIKVRISNNNGSRIGEIEDQFVKVGRDVKCGVSIQDDPSVSRLHAVIEVTPAGDCAVIDLGSGVTVNGKRVDKSALVAGDGFTVGGTSVEVISITPATSTVIRPPPVAPSAPMPAAKAQPRIAPPPPRRPEVRPVNPFVSAVRKLIARVVRAALEIEREER